MPLISLDQLTVVGVSPTELVDVAADAGYDAISPVAGGDPAFPAHKLAVGDAATKAMIERLAARGLSVNNLDGFTLTAEPDWDSYARMIELGLYIGARRGVAFLYDPDASRAQHNLFHLSEMAAGAGLELVLEFSAMSPVGSLAHAVDYVRGAPAPIGLVVDLMHLSYAGETPADVARCDPALISCAQLNDGRADLSFEEYLHDAMQQRQVPGDGELPVRDFLKALSADTPIGVEVPLKDLSDRGVSHLDRAKLLLERTRALLAEVGRA
jgi:sugar phosphate isomerase/epimerase